MSLGRLTITIQACGGFERTYRDVMNTPRTPSVGLDAQNLWVSSEHPPPFNPHTTMSSGWLAHYTEAGKRRHENDDVSEC